MSGTHSRVYLVAFTVWLLAWVAALTLPETTGVWLGVVAVSLFASNTVIFVLSLLRVQRGDAWRAASGTVLPIMAEFVMMGFGLRLPAAMANMRDV
jgi:hypothetical protein